jgi:hypothetical protein
MRLTDLAIVSSSSVWMTRTLTLSQIDGISYEKSEVLAKLTKEAIRQEPEYHDPPVGIADHDISRPGL